MKPRVLALLLVLVAGTARAEDRATAERYFRAGAKAYAAQNFAAAATDFDEAYRNLAMPEIAFSAAQAYRRLYRVDPDPAHVRRAIELYRAYLDKVKHGGRVGDAADNLAEMEHELEKLKALGRATEPKARAEDSHTRLGVSVTVGEAQRTVLHEIADVGGSLVDGLTATLDGKPIEPFALVDVAPTDHVLAIRAPGYAPVEKHVRAVAGQAQLVELELKAKPATVAVTTEPEAQIAVDGRPAATAPAAPLELAAGKHLITILHRGRQPFAKELVLERGETVALAAPLAQTPRRRAVPYVLGGAGALAAGAITTGILALVHDGRASDLHDAIVRGDRPPSDGDRFDHEVELRDRYVTATWVLGGAAIAGGAVGLALLWFDTPAPGEGMRFAPAVSSTSAGVTLAGRF